MPSLSDALFDIGPEVRYVATYRAGDLDLRERPGLKGSSESESDRYEELLVNPTLLRLASQRGNIDCGGLDYLLIRYGNFFQFVMALPDGHVSVALETTVDMSSVRQVQAVIQDAIRT
ncbi:MAG: hypothetical protein AAF170_17845 [Bacteroidota bacterium]